VRRAVVALLLLGTGAPARAASDYQVTSGEWNGLSRLADEARALGCPVQPTATLDWGALGPHDVLWFVYPRTPIDATQLGRYLAAGGRVVLADDFGAATDALGALGIRRARGGLDEADHYRENPNLPVARTALATDLGRATEELVANHPARFGSSLPSTFAFAPGAALVIEGQVGGGYFVALADPSVLINNMLQIDGNLAFARALVSRTCRPGERMLLLSHAFVSRGQASTTPLGEGGLSFDGFNQMIAGINQSLRQGSSDGAVLQALALLLAVGALIAFAGTFPARGRIDHHWTRLRQLLDAPPPTSLLALTHLPGDYAATAAVLRDEALARLNQALGEQLVPERTTPDELARKLGARLGTTAAEHARTLWREIGHIRWTTVDGAQVPDDRVTARQLRRLHEAAASLFSTLAAGAGGQPEA
jgi:hypothetical protein